MTLIKDSSYLGGAWSAACCLDPAGSDVGSSLCAGGLEMMHCLCASAYPGMEER